jgi:hypothetical protein
MSSYRNPDVTSEALRLREEQVSEYRQERALLLAQRERTSKPRIQLFCWRPALVAPHVTSSTEQQSAL